MHKGPAYVSSRFICSLTMNEKRAVVEELHRPARRHYQRRHVDIRWPDETWQSDLIQMSAYAKENRQHHFILLVIDTFSKFIWLRALKHKTGKDVTEAMKSILSEGRVPKNLQVDRGTEYYNSFFKDLMLRHNIHMYSTYSNLKSSIAERAVKTVKNWLFFQFSLQGSYKWLHLLSEFTYYYNNRKHRTIGMPPMQVTEHNAHEIRQRVYLPLLAKVSKKKPKFKVGDKVRVSRFKHVFGKGFTGNFTPEFFSVSKVKLTNSVTFLTDYQNQPIQGGFYEQELTSTHILNK